MLNCRFASHLSDVRDESNIDLAQQRNERLEAWSSAGLLIYSRRNRKRLRRGLPDARQEPSALAFVPALDSAQVLRQLAVTERAGTLDEHGHGDRALVHHQP